MRPFHVAIFTFIFLLIPQPLSGTASTANLEATSTSNTIMQEKLEDFSYAFDEFIVHSNLWGARLMKKSVPNCRFQLEQPQGGNLTATSYKWEISEPFCKPIFRYIGYGDRMWKPFRK